MSSTEKHGTADGHHGDARGIPRLRRVVSGARRRPILETPRLLVRDWEDADLDAVFRIYSDPEVVAFFFVPPDDRAASAARLRRMRQRNADHPGEYGGWAMVERASGHVVGTLLLKELEDSGEIEVGWHLARDAWGHGYATEGARAALDHAFGRVGLLRVVCVIHPDNLRSLAVARRLGLHPRGMRHHYDQDLAYFDVTAEEWRSRRADTE